MAAKLSIKKFASIIYPMRYKKPVTFTLSFFLLSLLLFSSCSYKNREAMLKTPYDADTLSNVFVANPSETPKEYYNIIKPEDELAISNLQDMDLIIKKFGENTQAGTTYATFRVDAQGEITLPKIGTLKVAGLSRAEAASAIQKAYNKNELNNPIIDVRIINLYVSVLGEAVHQGKYLIGREDYQLIDLLADAGGLTPNANKRMLKIFRGPRENPEIILVNLTDYNFLKNPKMRLQAKDIVYIEPKRLATNSQNFQNYSSFIQLGLVIVNTLLIIYTLTK
jgi:polysaccharide export outer membrane protein